MYKQSMQSLVVSLAVLLVAPFSALALGPIEGCIESGEPKSVTYFLVDRSDELQDTQNLAQSLKVLKRMLSPGERLIVGVSTGSASDTHVIFDRTMPEESLWVSKLKIRAAQRKFDACYEKMSAAVQEQGESYPHSALLETLMVVSKALDVIPVVEKRVVLYSDMVQNSSEVSFFGKKEFSVDGTIKAIEKKDMLASFMGTKFHVAGAGVGVPEAKARRIESFWKAYVEKCGGSLEFYGPVLFASS